MTSEPPRILVICRHNSGRSQIAEAYLDQLADGRLVVESAGLEPAAAVNPLVVDVMKEDGLDISAKKPQSVFSLFSQGRLYDHVITVCSDTEDKCPVFPGITRRWHQPFPDPAEVTGSLQEKRAAVRRIRDQIKDWLLHPADGDFSLGSLLD